MVLRSLAVIVLFAASACGFTAATPSGDDGGGDDIENPPPPPTAQRKCADDPALRLCIDFDDDQTPTSDGSGRGHDAIGVDFVMMNRDAEQAVLVDADSRITIPESADLDIQTHLAISLLANPANLPAHDRSYWALDNNRQYFIAYDEDGKFRCGIGSATVDAAVGVTPGGWYDVVCTYDQGQLKLFIDGYLAGCRGVGPVPTEGAEGLAIGGNIGAGQSVTEKWIGGLDNIQVFARSFSTQELCAGKQNCFQPGWNLPNGPGGFASCL